MRENAERLERTFSDLGVLQAPGSISYSCTMHCESLQQYCISVKEYRCGVLCGSEMVLVCTDAQKIHDILVFLCENGITPMVLRDILLDLRGQGLLTMEG